MSPHQDRPASQFSLFGLLVFLFIIGIVVLVVVVPGLLFSGRTSNERTPSTSLKTLAFAEADFRANDRDWNRVNDYWTGDVKGLYTMTSAAVRGAFGNTTTDPSIKLIELSLAAADADPVFVPAGGENAALDVFAVSSAKAGYWYAAMNTDRSVNPLREEPRYRQDTGGVLPMGPCHHISRFGFVSFPDSKSAGRYVFIVNENNTIYRAAVTSGSLRGPGTPPGVGKLPSAYLNWPAEADLKTWWSKID